MKVIRKCRCCGSNNLIKYLNLGLQPLANNYHHGEFATPYPLEVVVCRECFHNQLSVVVDPEEMFENYLFVTGTSATLTNHKKELAKDVISRLKRKRLSVLDIGSNDGTQLEIFKSMGCRVLGVDPAKNLAPLALKKGVNTLVEYWGEKVASRMTAKFDIISGTNVFAHVDRADEFLLSCKTVLNNEGMIVLEFPYLVDLVEHMEFDTVYHEHLSYFLVNSLRILVKRVGLNIVDIVRTPIYGGSLRVFIGQTERESNVVEEMIAVEKKEGFLRVKKYQDFATEVKKLKVHMKKSLKLLTKRKMKLIGYGASAKGNTILNYFEMDLSYISDDNPLKWGFLTPGRNIPIVNPLLISQEKNKLGVVMLSWNYTEEIIKKIRKLRRGKSGDVVITHVPTVNVLPI